MTDAQQLAAFRLCLQAALADGSTSPAERQALEKIAAGLRAKGIPAELPPVGAAGTRIPLPDLAATLREPALARDVYEAATAVCSADEPLNPSEKWFLDELRSELGLDSTQTAGIHATAAAIIAPPPARPVVAGTIASSEKPIPDTAQVDRSILNHALLAGALELLPDTLATMAIVSVQMRLVYEIGKMHGFELDRGHIKDFLAAAGVGLASQVVESFAERLVRGLAGKFGGGLVRGLAGQATSSGMSFGTTWALGQLARQYYAGGRRFEAIQLRDLYDRFVAEGRSLEAQYLPQMREQAAKLKLSNLSAAFPH